MGYIMRQQIKGDQQSQEAITFISSSSGKMNLYLIREGTKETLEILQKVTLREQGPGSSEKTKNTTSNMLSLEIMHNRFFSELRGYCKKIIGVKLISAPSSLAFKKF